MTSRAKRAATSAAATALAPCARIESRAMPVPRHLGRAELQDAGEVPVDLVGPGTERG